jgi:short-subunit dehydrogenase
MIGTHILASTELIYAALPGMIERRHGIIINVSSLASFMPGLCRSMYLATKSFIHNFSQALSIELSNYGIYIQSLCPGFVKTDFFRSHQGPDHAQKYRNMHFTSPEDVVNESFLSIEKGKSLCIPGTMNKIFYLFARLLPIPVFRLIYHLRMEKQDRKKPEPDLIVCYGSAA